MDNLEDLVKSEYKKGFRNALIFGLILVIVWAALLAVLPSGWWIAVINIGFFVATAIVIGIGSFVFLRLYMGRTIAAIVSGVIWMIVVVGIRSLILQLLGVI